MAPITTPAVLLRSHDYGDTSRILRFFTRDLGLLSVMARGVRGKSGKGKAAIASFATGDLTAYVKAQRDLHTMKDFAAERLRTGLGGHVLRFAGAAAVGELVLSHHEQEANPVLYQALEDALDVLEEAPEERLPTACLAGLWRVVEGFGFAPQLDPCVLCAESIGPEDMGRFDFSAGGVRCPRCAAESAGPRVGPGAREQIRGLLLGQVDASVTHPRRHLSVLGDFVSYHVTARPLKSLRFLEDLLPAEEGEEEA